MLTDEQYNRAIALAADVLRKYNFISNNRSLQILLYDILPCISASKLRMVQQSKYETLLTLIRTWVPSPELYRKLQLSLITRSLDG